jgi:hypothetical protein
MNERGKSLLPFREIHGRAGKYYRQIILTYMTSSPILPAPDGEFYQISINKLKLSAVNCGEYSILKD